MLSWVPPPSMGVSLIARTVSPPLKIPARTWTDQVRSKSYLYQIEIHDLLSSTIIGSLQPTHHCRSARSALSRKFKRKDPAWHHSRLSIRHLVRTSSSVPQETTTHE